MKLPASPRIAIVKLSSLGDVVHALPVARALRRLHPRAQLTWIAEAPESAILRDHPDIDDVVPVDTRKWRRLLWQPSGARAVLRELEPVRRRIRSGRFDVAIDLQGLIKSGMLTACTRAPVRIGFTRARCRERFSSVFTNRRVTPPAAAVHVVDQYLSLLAPLGIEPGPPEFHLAVHPVADQRMEDFLSEHGIKRGDVLVGINPGAGRPEKQWPVPGLAALAERLATECAARLLILWGPNESHLAREVRDRLSARAILAPPTDLHELMALLRRCALLVANDTGPLHMAAALGTPCLGLYGPTRAERNGPYGVRCHGCQSRDGTMAGIDARAVFDAAQFLLDTQRAGA